jgi:hypothetical protein
MVDPLRVRVTGALAPFAEGFVVGIRGTLARTHAMRETPVAKVRPTIAPAKFVTERRLTVGPRSGVLGRPRDRRLDARSADASVRAKRSRAR